jgi:hypothetical protein
MGERGRTIHVRDGGAREALPSAGYRVAVVGTNERWTTFVPMDASTFKCERVSKILDRAVLEVWFDDDIGLAIQVYSSGDFVGELSLPGEDGDVTEADLELVGKLEELDVLSRSQRSTLLERMSDTNGLREWTMKHGVEKLLDLPSYETMPPDLLEGELRNPLPGSAKAAKTRTSKPKAVISPGGPTPPPKESWSNEESATLDLHCEYWGTVFSMNNWKLYNRYKKHLPADQRRDVDELCNAVAMGDDDELAERVRSILARVWHCDNWDSVIRNAELIDGDEDVWQAWRSRVST